MIKCPYCGSEDTRILKTGKIMCNECEETFEGDDVSAESSADKTVKVFFSYGHDKHAKMVKHLANAIKKQSDGKIDVWIDSSKIKPGNNWREEITKGIQDSNHFMAFLSEYSSREHGVCLDELAIAIATKYGMIKTFLLEKPSESFRPSAAAAEYQWGDMSDYNIYRKKGKTEYSEHIRKKAREIIELLNDKEIVRYNNDIIFLRCKLCLPLYTPATRFEQLLKNEMTGREWLVEKVNEWRQAPDSPRVMVIYGKPGAGKSMFSSHLQHYNPWIAASLSCEYTSDEFSSTDSIIVWIAYKLAMRLPDYRSKLMYLFTQENTDIGTGQDRFTRLITDLLNDTSINGSHENMVILIDALDETRNDDLITFLNKYINDFTPWLKFLVTARKEPRITEHFSRYPYIDIDEASEQNHSDMIAYYKAVLDEKLKKKYHEEKRLCFYERLTAASGGVFTYAECVCRNIIDDINSGADTDLPEYPLPQGINDLFKNTLDRKFCDPDEFGNMRDYEGVWQEPLGIIAASPKPIPKQTLMKIMCWNNNKYKSFMRPLSTLIAETDGCLQVFHRSFGEWLDSTETCYASSRSDGLGSLADRCFAIYKTGVENTDEFILTGLTRLLRESGKKKEYNELKNDDDFINAVSDKTDELYKSNRLREALDICDEMTEVLKGSYHYNKFLCVKGDVLRSLDRFSEALDMYEQALETERDSAKKYPHDPRFQCNLSTLLTRAADILKDQNKIPEALELYKQSLEKNTELAEKYPEDPEYKHSLIISLTHIADICTEQDNVQEASDTYRRALEIERDLTENYPEEPDYKYSLSITLARLGDILKKQNRVTETLELYNQSYEAIKSLADKYPEDPVYQRNLSISLSRIADVLTACRKLSDALDINKHVLDIRKRLAEKYPENPQYQNDLAFSLAGVADILKAQNNLQEALELYEQLKEINRNLAENYPENPKYQNDLSVSVSRTAEILKAQNKLPEALDMHRQALEIKRRIAGKYPENPGYQLNLYISLSGTADILKARNSLQEALDTHKEAAEICGRLAETYPEVHRYQLNLSCTLIKIADILNEQEMVPEAVEYYVRAIDAKQKVIQKCPDDITYLRSFSFDLQKAAVIFARNGLKGALTLSDEDVSINKHISEVYPDDPQYQFEYAESLYNAASINEKYHRSAEAVILYNSAIKTAEKLAEMYPENMTYQQMIARSCYKKVNIYLERDDDNSVVSNLKKAHKAYMTMADKYPDSEECQENLALSYYNLVKFADEKEYIKNALEIAGKYPNRQVCRMIADELSL